MLVSTDVRRRALSLSLLLALVMALLAAPQAPAQEDDPILDPIPEQPEPSGLGLTLEEVASFPKSEPTPPPIDPRLMRQARINYIDELPDGSGRMAVPDLNGKLYLVEDGSPMPYLDVGATFAPDFWSVVGSDRALVLSPSTRSSRTTARSTRFTRKHSGRWRPRRPTFRPSPTPSIMGS